MAACIYVEGVRMGLGMHPEDLIDLPHIHVKNYSIRSMHGRATLADARRIVCTLVRVYGYKERLYAYAG
jgi:hypothetical protein